MCHMKRYTILTGQAKNAASSCLAYSNPCGQCGEMQARYAPRPFSHRIECGQRPILCKSARKSVILSRDNNRFFVHFMPMTFESQRCPCWHTRVSARARTVRSHEAWKSWLAARKSFALNIICQQRWTRTGIRQNIGNQIAAIEWMQWETVRIGRFFFCLRSYKCVTCLTAMIIFNHFVLLLVPLPLTIIMWHIAAWGLLHTHWQFNAYEPRRSCVRCVYNVWAGRPVERAITETFHVCLPRSKGCRCKRTYLA